MTLPKAKKIKMIKKGEFEKTARVVRESLKDEIKYLNERKEVKND